MTGRVPRLFFVAASLPDSGGRDAIDRTLVAALGPEEVRKVNDGAWLCYSEALDAAALRDALLPHDVFVVEFERWSASGSAVDAAWLHRRGH